jgi:hypothetical protein
MKRHLVTAGKGLAGAGLTGAVLYLVTTATIHRRPVWPYWVLLAMVVAGLLLYLVGQERAGSGQAGDSGQDDTAAAARDEADAIPEQPADQPGPVITGRWRSTNDGFEVPALMRLRDHSMSHPAYMRRSTQDSQPPPSILIGALVACDPLGPAPATSAIRASLLAFLSREPVSALVAELTHAGPGADWTPWGANGRITFTAILTGDDEDAAPAAVARLLPPIEGTSIAGRDSRLAELVLYVEPRAPDGTTAPPVNLAAWHDRLVRALAVPEALAGFLNSELGLATSGDPLAQAGVTLDVPNSMTELVDTEGLEPVPGSSVSTWFMGWAVADPDGAPAPALARQWLTQMCDSTLKLNGYEPVLAAAGTPGQSSPDDPPKAGTRPAAKDT